ncbi:MAG: hypothetical protein AABN95_03930, partial [Acidobacteriota bacterium]
RSLPRQLAPSPPRKLSLYSIRPINRCSEYNLQVAAFATTTTRSFPTTQAKLVIHAPGFARRPAIPALNSSYWRKRLHIMSDAAYEIEQEIMKLGHELARLY